MGFTGECKAGYWATQVGGEVLSQSASAGVRDPLSESRVNECVGEGERGAV